MKFRRLTEHEIAAVMIVTHVVQQCMSRKASTVPLRVALSQSQAGALAKDGQKIFKRLIDAGLEHRLLGQQGSDIFMTQLGKMLLAFSELSRGTPENFEEQTRDHDVLEAVLTAIAGDTRFSPEMIDQKASVGRTISESTALSPGATENQAPSKSNFWIGLLIVGTLVILGLYQLIKHI